MARNANVRVSVVVACVVLTSSIVAGAAEPKSAAKAKAPSATVQAVTESFWRPAMSYLKTAHTQSTAVAQSLANLNDGITTPSDIKAMILKARFVENAAFQGEFQAHATGDAPPDLAPLMSATEEVHAGFQSSTATILDGWKSEPDSKLLESGIAAFKAMVVQLNGAVETGNAWAKAHSAPAK